LYDVRDIHEHIPRIGDMTFMWENKTVMAIPKRLSSMPQGFRLLSDLNIERIAEIYQTSREHPDKQRSEIFRDACCFFDVAAYILKGRTRSIIARF
jgi:hypothetical protein